MVVYPTEKPIIKQKLIFLISENPWIFLNYVLSAKH